ncbi:unnamed protein product, partial [Musa textilis]
ESACSSGRVGTAANPRRHANHDGSHRNGRGGGGDSRALGGPLLRPPPPVLRRSLSSSTVTRGAGAAGIHLRRRDASPRFLGAWPPRDHRSAQSSRPSPAHSPFRPQARAPWPQGSRPCPQGNSHFYAAPLLKMTL